MKIQIRQNKPAPDGFTIIEVTIFLAISAILLASAMIMIGGKQNQVSFDEKMRDTLTEINQVISDVPSGFSGADPAAMYCMTDGSGRPVIMSGSQPAGYKPNCIFLGKAIQFSSTNTPGVTVNNASNMYIYSIFGIHHESDGVTLPPDLVDAKPAAAVGQRIGTSQGVDLTQTFSLNPAYVKSVTSNTVTPAPGDTSYAQSHLVGFLLSLNTQANTSTNGSEDVNTYAYRFDGTPSGNVDTCLNLQSSPCGVPSSGGYSKLNWPDRLTEMTVCLTDGQRTAQIIITSAGGYGAQTELKYVSC